MAPHTDFMESVSAYRLHAAAAFRSHLERKRSQQLKTRSVPSTEELFSYKRVIFPQLQAYLDSASSRYAFFKQNKESRSKVLQTNCQTRKNPGARTLGSCTVTLRNNFWLHADVRRDCFLRHLAYTRHRKLANRLDVPLTLSTNSLHPGSTVPKCLVPLDIIRTFASRHKCVANLPQRPAFRNLFPPPRLTSICVPAAPLRTTTSIPVRISGFLPPLPCEEHSMLCRLSLAAGRSSHRLAVSKCVKLDSAEAVHKRYAGKPDEIYRRKTSRRYAVWRRQQRQAQLAESQKVSKAEHAMRDSRGVDQLMTHRSVGDRSFAPFLFDLESRAYAFSSRISEAPKLRNAMLQKYSVPKASGNATDSLRTARLAAEVNPLFHTRVMNRFA